MRTIWYYIAEWFRLKSSPILQQMGFTVEEMVEARKEEKER